MHEFDEEIDALAAKILEYSLIRLKKDPPLDGPWSYEELYSEVGETITAKEHLSHLLQLNQQRSLI